MVKKKAMGKGLSALLSDAEPKQIPSIREGEGISEIEIEKIVANPFFMPNCITSGSFRSLI